MWRCNVARTRKVTRYTPRQPQRGSTLAPRTPGTARSPWRRRLRPIRRLTAAVNNVNGTAGCGTTHAPNTVGCERGNWKVGSGDVGGRHGCVGARVGVEHGGRVEFGHVNDDRWHGRHTINGRWRDGQGLPMDRRLYNGTGTHVHTHTARGHTTPTAHSLVGRRRWRRCVWLHKLRRVTDRWVKWATAANVAADATTDCRDDKRGWCGCGGRGAGAPTVATRAAVAATAVPDRRATTAGVVTGSSTMGAGGCDGGTVHTHNDPCANYMDGNGGDGRCGMAISRVRRQRCASMGQAVIRRPRQPRWSGGVAWCGSQYGDRLGLTATNASNDNVAATGAGLTTRQPSWQRR